MVRFLVVSVLTVVSFLMSATPALAQAAPAAGPSQLLQFVPIIFAFVVMIVYTNYSSKKRANERDQFLSKLERGSEVITNGGLLGRIEGLTDLYITLEIAPGTRVKVLRSAVAGLAKNVNASSTAASEVKS